MLELDEGGLRLSDAPFNHRLTVAWRTRNAWRPLSLLRNGDALAAADGPLRVRLRLEPSRVSGTWNYHLAFDSAEPTRLRLFLELPHEIPGGDAFHLIPAFLFGDNNFGP